MCQFDKIDYFVALDLRFVTVAPWQWNHFFFSLFYQYTYRCPTVFNSRTSTDQHLYLRIPYSHGNKILTVLEKLAGKEKTVFNWSYMNFLKLILVSVNSCYVEKKKLLLQANNLRSYTLFLI